MMTVPNAMARSIAVWQGCMTTCEHLTKQIDASSSTSFTPSTHHDVIFCLSLPLLHSYSSFVLWGAIYLQALSLSSTEGIISFAAQSRSCLALSSLRHRSTSQHVAPREVGHYRHVSRRFSRATDGRCWK